MKYSKTTSGGASTCTDAVSGSAAIVGLDGVLEALQARGPQLRQERLERLEALRTDLVEPAAALRADGDEARVLEHVQVLRDRLLGDVEVLGDLVDRARAVTDEEEHRPPAWLRQGREGRLPRRRLRPHPSRARRGRLRPAGHQPAPALR